VEPIDRPLLTQSRLSRFGSQAVWQPAFAIELRDTPSIFVMLLELDFVIKIRGHDQKANAKFTTRVMHAIPELSSKIIQPFE
jgi:hypothetical protein